MQPNWTLKAANPNGKLPEAGLDDQYESVVDRPRRMKDFDSVDVPLSTKIQVDDDEEDDKKESEEKPPKVIAVMLNFQAAIGKWYRRHKSTIKSVILAVLAIAYAAYFGYAMWYNLEGEDSIRLLWITCVVVFFCIVSLIRDTCGTQIYNSCLSPTVTFIESRFVFFKWLEHVLLYTARFTLNLKKCRNRLRFIKQWKMED